MPDASALEVEEFAVTDDEFAGDAAAFGFGDLDVDDDLAPKAVAGWIYIYDRATGKLLCHSPNMIPHENLFAQPRAKDVRMLPGANGGVEWSPGAFNAETKMAYFVNLHQPMNYAVKTTSWDKGRLWLTGAFTSIPGEQQWGNICAIDTTTGKIAWSTKTKNPMISGAMTTAGGLVFAGEGNGMFSALDAKSGKILWGFQAGAGRTRRRWRSKSTVSRMSRSAATSS